MKPDEAGFDRFAPENVAAVAVLARVRPVQRHQRPGREGAGRRRAAARGLAAAHRGDQRQAVDDRLGRRGPRPRCSPSPTARSRRSSSPSPEYADVKLEWGAEDEAFRAELVAFLDEHAPPEIKVGRDFTDGGVDEVGGHEVIPQWARDWQATLFDHGWMIPSYPPELGGRNATPVQTLIYMEEMAQRRIPRSLHFPGYAIVAPSLLEFGNDEQRALAAPSIRGDIVWCIGMSEPNAGQRPRVAHDPRGARRRSLRRQRPEGVDVVLDGGRRSASATCARPGRRAEAQGHQRADHRHGHAGHRRAPAAPHHRRGGLRRGVLHRRRGAGRRTSSVPSTTAGASRWARSRTSAADCGCSRSRWCSRRVDDLCAMARRHGLDRDAGVRRRLAEAYEQVASLRALGYKGFAVVRAGQLGARALLPEAGDVRARQVAVRARHGAPRAVRRGGRSRAGDEHGRWAHSFFVSFANTIAGGSSEIQRNIIATRVLGLPRG